METLYNLADKEIRACISDYLELVDATNGLTDVQPLHLNTVRKIIILLAGLNAQDFELSPELAAEEWKRRQALHFELETAITYGVYVNIRLAGVNYLNSIELETKGFKDFTPEFIHKSPYFLPIFQHLSGVFSKAALKAEVGSVSDNSISKPAAIRLSNLLKQRVVPEKINKGEILKRLESTLEGIVRDLVGRVLLESIVDSALAKKGIQYKREEEYSSLSGVIYNIRADFVIPDEINPLAFIEVRKSSSRHASLYAKDKMFSAINWKGRHKKMLGILIVDGEWTSETLKVMANIFDYVVPISKVNDLAEILEEYINGDETKLKWLVDFKVTENSGLKKNY